MSVRSPKQVGRTGEAARLLAAVRAGLEGSGPALVLVLGEAGMGKSRLVSSLSEPARLAPTHGDEAAEEAAAAGVPVVCRAAAMPGGAATPLLPWADALRQAVMTYGPDVAAAAAGPALPQLALLLPGLDPDAGVDADGRAADLLPWFIGRLAAVRPLVVVLDDLHLADAATLATLTRVVDPAPAGLVVVATATSRHEPEGSSSAWAAHGLRLRRLASPIELGPLDDAEAAELVRELARENDLTLDDATTAEIVARAEGNPFFVEELLAVRGSGRGTVPPAEVLGVRISALSSPALAVAEAAAVHGAGVSHGLLRELAGLDEPALLDGLRELVTAGLLVGDPGGDGYAFRQTLVGDAVRERMLPVERRRLHAACARSVESALIEATPARRRRLLGSLPLHWTEAGRPDLALGAAVRAAEANAAVDPDAAAAHYLHAVELDGLLRSTDRGNAPDAEAVSVEAGPQLSRVQLLERLAEQRGAAGDAVAATESARAALLLATDDATRRVDPAAAARLHRLIAVHGEGVLADTEVAAAFDAAVRAAEELGPSAELAAALAAQARHELVLDHNSRAVPSSRRARDIAAAVGAEPEEALAAATLGASLCYLGQFEEGLRTLAYAVPALEAARRPYDAARAMLTLAWAQFHGGDPLSGHAAAERAATALREGGGPRDVAVRLDAAALEMAVALGHWDLVAPALQRLDPLGEGDPAAEVLTVEAALLRSVRAELALRRGDVEWGRSGYGAVLAHWDRLGLRQYDASSLARLAEMAVDAGDVSLARTYVGDGLEAVEAADTWVAVLGFARAGLAVEAAAARLGRPVDQERVDRLGELVRRATAGAPVGSVAAAERATALAELSRVNGREDPEAWMGAVDAWAALGFPWWRGAAQLRQAEALVARRGARREAADIVSDVLATADLLGARGLQGRAGDLARRAGLEVPRPRQGEPEASTTSGVAPGQVPAPREPRVVQAELDPPGEAAGDPLDPLSAREREVVMLLSAGASNRRIAEQLFISEKTASVHVSHILAKLGVSSRLEAAAVVHRTR